MVSAIQTNNVSPKFDSIEQELSTPRPVSRPKINQKSALLNSNPQSESNRIIAESPPIVKDRRDIINSNKFREFFPELSNCDSTVVSETPISSYQNEKNYDSSDRDENLSSRNGSYERKISSADSFTRRNNSQKVHYFQCSKESSRDLSENSGTDENPELNYHCSSSASNCEVTNPHRKGIEDSPDTSSLSLDSNKETEGICLKYLNPNLVDSLGVEAGTKVTETVNGVLSHTQAIYKSFVKDITLLDKQNTRLQQKVNLLETKLQSKNRELKHINEYVDDLKCEVEKIKTNILRKNTDTISSYEQNETELKLTIQQQNSIIEDLKNEIRNQESKLLLSRNNLNEEDDILEQKLAENQNRISNLQSQLNLLTQKYAALQKENKMLKKKETELEKNCQALINREKNYIQELNNKNFEYNSKTEELIHSKLTEEILNIRKHYRRKIYKLKQFVRQFKNLNCTLSQFPLNNEGTQTFRFQTQTTEASAPPGRAFQDCYAFPQPGIGYATAFSDSSKSKKTFQVSNNKSEFINQKQNYSIAFQT